ncbi:sulfite exporter TauE/SafE family protein [Paractinoplanes lichenicola]|uniref:Probable membrane transporter protein n=1 Tax=Paractinoplanes lichenicola TaxID=2802976 RepID=A0ABS1W573_9ACTN|nr:sulfite exporter TauE/SafE family protein [Actinoplanes lichenicola]MBL7261891.1 sulfite exporter TauE/SafE family protein [Actinoplanes lichenicola]
MRVGDAFVLVLGGVGGGLTGSMAGLASLASYPALLAVGLPPIAANVTNTVALLSNTVGTAVSARRELRGHGRRLVRLCAVAAVGGLAGAVLLLATPSSAFERIVPVLVALGAVLLLLRDQLRRWAGHRSMPTVALGLAICLIGVYGGYFGAAAGVLVLAVLSVAATEPLAVTNAIKSIVLGASNLAAAVIYAVVAPVNWAAAGLMAVGCLFGSWLGPILVRRIPERPLRVAIALAALGLAVYLWWQAGN